eukprot:2195438-Rhodomonas_salina.8
MEDTLFVDALFGGDIERFASVPSTQCKVQVLRKTRSLPTPKSPNPSKPEVFNEYFGAKVAAAESITSTRRAKSPQTNEILESGRALFDIFYGIRVAVAVEPASLQNDSELFEGKDTKNALQMAG